MITDNLRTILLVEDEPLIAMAEKRKIRGFGYEVVTANSGEKAVEIALTRPDIGLILMDIDLGAGIDGTEAAKIILGKRSLPIVFVSSQNNLDTVQKLRGIARYGYVLKTSGDFVLQASIESALELFESRAGSDAPAQQSDQEFRLLFENTNEGVAIRELVYDAAGKVVDLRYIAVNSAYERHTGLKPEDILGRNMLDVLPNADRKRMDIWAKVALTGEPDSYEYYSKTLHRHLLVRSFSPRRGQVATILEDISEQKRIQKSLQEESARRQILFDQSPDGILIVDPQTARFLEFNATAHRQLGYSREEFARLSIPDIEAQKSPDETRTRMADVIKNGRADFETLHVTHQGKLRNVHVTAQIITFDGKPVYFCTWRDITERIAAEEALLQSEMRFRNLFQKHAATMLLIDSRTGKIIDANASALQFYGYTLEKICTMSIQEINASPPGSGRPGDSACRRQQPEAIRVPPPSLQRRDPDRRSAFIAD
jgi:PAS domain S-box-containing protein